MTYDLLEERLTSTGEIPGNDATIINVDDNEPARYARGRLLRQVGFRVIDAATGQETLEAVQKVHPDLILLDVHLPDIGGIEVCRRIRSSPEHASVIILQISASATSAPHATDSLNSGADAYLVEPVDPDVLIATIRAMMRLRRAEREALEANAALRTLNSQLRTLNEALQRSNEDLQHFAYVASHDLQEPLRTIKSYVQLIERTMSERFQERERAYFHFITEGADRMRNLIDALLAYSRIGRERGTEFEAFSLQSAFDWALMNLHEGIIAAKATVTSLGLPEVWGDSVRLAQVFQNLIGNAVKYRRPDVEPVIEVSARRDSSGDWVVSVSDNGMGIARDYHERIFVPFKRLHGQELPGAGIGLALCRRIVESHGGRIWLESAPGKGSTFFFSLKPAPSPVT